MRGWQPAPAFGRQGCFKATQAGNPHHPLSAKTVSKLCKPTARASISCQGCFEAVRAGIPHRHLSAMLQSRAGWQPAPAFERKGYFEPCGLAARTGILAPGLLQSHNPPRHLSAGPFQSRAGWQPALAFERLGCFKAVRAGSSQLHLIAWACFKAVRAGSPPRHLSAWAASKPCGLAAPSCI